MSLVEVGAVIAILRSVNAFPFYVFFVRYGQKSVQDICPSTESVATSFVKIGTVKAELHLEA